MSLLVCSACGSPSCWEGEFYCEEYKRAGTLTCSCEWTDNQLTAVDPHCEAHGDDDTEHWGYWTHGVRS